METILRLPEVTRRTGYKRSSIYRKVADGTFPSPVKLGDRAIGFYESQVAQWVASRERAGASQGAK